MKNFTLPTIWYRLIVLVLVLTTGSACLTTARAESELAQVDLVERMRFNQSQLLESARELSVDLAIPDLMLHIKDIENPQLSDQDILRHLTSVSEDKEFEVMVRLHEMRGVFHLNQKFLACQFEQYRSNSLWRFLANIGFSEMPSLRLSIPLNDLAPGGLESEFAKSRLNWEHGQTLLHGADVVRLFELSTQRFSC